MGKPDYIKARLFVDQHAGVMRIMPIVMTSINLSRLTTKGAFSKELSEFNDLFGKMTASINESLSQNDCKLAELGAYWYLVQMLAGIWIVQCSGIAKAFRSIQAGDLIISSFDSQLLFGHQLSREIVVAFQKLALEASEYYASALSGMSDRTGFAHDVVSEWVPISHPSNLTLQLKETVRAGGLELSRLRLGSGLYPSLEAILMGMRILEEHSRESQLLTKDRLRYGFSFSGLASTIRELFQQEADMIDLAWAVDHFIDNGTIVPKFAVTNDNVGLRILGFGEAELQHAAHLIYETVRYYHEATRQGIDPYHFDKLMVLLGKSIEKCTGINPGFKWEPYLYGEVGVVTNPRGSVVDIDRWALGEGILKRDSEGRYIPGSRFHNSPWFKHNPWSSTQMNHIRMRINFWLDAVESKTISWPPEIDRGDLALSISTTNDENHALRAAAKLLEMWIRDPEPTHADFYKVLTRLSSISELRSSESKSAVTAIYSEELRQVDKLLALAMGKLHAFRNLEQIYSKMTEVYIPANVAKRDLVQVFDEYIMPLLDPKPLLENEPIKRCLKVLLDLGASLTSISLTWCSERYSLARSAGSTGNSTLVEYITQYNELAQRAARELHHDFPSFPDPDKNMIVCGEVVQSLQRLISILTSAYEEVESQFYVYLDPWLNPSKTPSLESVDERFYFLLADIDGYTDLPENEKQRLQRDINERIWRLGGGKGVIGNAGFRRCP
jgi:hypothetical protein